MKARWWTCGCGRKNCTKQAGTPVCSSCGKPAQFTVEPPKGQTGLQFSSKPAEDGGY